MMCADRSQNDRMTLAIYGGKAARSTKLPANYPGAIVMGAPERENAANVIMAQSPFRYYGPDMQHAVKTLEDTMSQELGIPYVLCVTSCTAALIVALKALGIGYGDKVIVPANTFIATAGAVICCNAVPIFVDVDESLNLDPHDLERVYDNEVKAIIAVPILGNPCDMDGIMAFAQKHHLYVIEDVAQSCGAMYKGKYAGTIGDMGTFSFQMNKIITAGEGGAVVTRNPKWFENAVRYHDQGLFREKERYGFHSVEETSAVSGQNYRMSEVSGAILTEQWNKLYDINLRMKNNYSVIFEVLSNELPSLQFRKINDPNGCLGSNLGMILPTHQTAVSFVQALAAENIDMYFLYGGKPVYMAPQILHQKTLEKNHFPFDFPFKKPVIYSEQMCPRALDLMSRTVFLPISPILTDLDNEEICLGIIKVFTGLNINY